MFMGLALEQVFVFSGTPPEECRAAGRVLGCNSWGHSHSCFAVHLLVLDSVVQVIEPESNFCSYP